MGTCVQSFSPRVKAPTSQSGRWMSSRSSETLSRTKKVVVEDASDLHTFCSYVCTSTHLQKHSYTTNIYTPKNGFVKFPKKKAIAHLWHSVGPVRRQASTMPWVQNQTKPNQPWHVVFWPLHMCYGTHWRSHTHTHTHTHAHTHKHMHTQTHTYTHTHTHTHTQFKINLCQAWWCTP